MRISNRLLCAFLGVFITLLTFIPVANAQDYNSNLVSHWKMDEITGTLAVDSAGSNDGTMQNGLNASADSVAGMLRRALHFTGANDQRIFVPHHASQLASTGYGTWSIWFKTDGSWPTSNGGDASLLSKRSSNCASDGVGISLLSTGKISASARNGGCWGGDDCSITYTNSSLFNNEWHHVVLTFGKLSTDRSYLYLDGKLVSSCSGNADWNFGSYNFKIGDGECTCEEEFKGQLDDVRIYDRALSSKDVLSLYEARAAGTLRYNDSGESLEYHDDRNWVHTGLGSYSPNAVNFDGVNDYFTVNPNPLAGSSKQITGSFWIKPDSAGSGTTRRIIRDNQNNFAINISNSDTFSIYSEGVNSGGSNVLSASSSALTHDEWHHIMFSFDMSDVGKRHIYVDGVDDTNITTYTDDTLLIMSLLTGFGGTHAGINLMSGDMADVWLESGTYIDFSVEANRHKFISKNGMPMMLGKNGSLPTGQPPSIFLSGDTEDWHKNKGTGGDFTETGEITDAATNAGKHLLKWEQVGNGVAMTSHTTSAIAKLTQNTIAYADSNNNTLTTYSWDGTDWTQVGNDLSIGIGPQTRLTPLNNNTIVEVSGDNGATADNLTTYSWDGTDWTQIGNTFTLPVSSHHAITTLDNTTIAYIGSNDEDITTYSWDGTDWSQVGNVLSLATSIYRPDIDALDSTTIVLNDTGTEGLRTYSWDGTDWSQVGNSFTLADSSEKPAITAINSDTIAMVQDEIMQTYSWDGTDWTAFGQPYTITGAGNTPAIELFRGNTVAFTDNTNDTLQTYQFAFCSAPERIRGTVVFNSTFNLMQYCNGVDWVAMGDVGGTGFGCSDPSGDAGDMVYNDDYNIMQYCDSENWRGVGKNIYSLLDSGLVGHWKLDETSGTTAVDSSGYGRDGTMVGGLDAGNDSVEGILDDAFNFDGVDDAVQIPTITFSDTDEWTLSAWLFDEHSSGDGNWIGRNGVSTYFMVHNNGYWYRDSAGAYFEYVDSAGRASYTNRWALHTFVADGTGTIDFYIDGSLITTLSGIADSSLVFNRLGHAYYNANNAADVSMDDVRLWDRAFNTGEVSALYSLYIEPDITSGLLGHWKLDETAGISFADSSGNGHTGVAAGSVDAAVHSVLGKDATAIDFTGSTPDLIDIGSDAAFDDLGPMSASAWIYPRNEGLNGSGHILAKGSLFNNFWSFRMGSGGQLTFERDGATTNMRQVTLSGEIVYNEWQHVAFTWNGTATAATSTKLYINGKEAPVSIPDHLDGSGGMVSDAGESLTIGNQSAGARTFDGFLDDVRLYSRVLSGPDVALLYASTQPSLSDGLVGHWMLDETTGNVIFDSSGNGNNGAWSDGSGNDVGEETVIAIIETGLDFDGSNDLVNLGNDTSLQLIGDMSVSLWVNFDSLTTGQRILNYQAGGETLATNDLYSLALSNSSPYNDLVVGHENGAGINSGQASFDTNLSAGAWYHVALVRDSSNTQTSLYLNNTLISTSSYANNPDGGSAGSLYLGYDVPNSGAYDLDGKLDDVRIYNRMLTTSDIQALYDLYAPAIPTNGLISHWSFDEVSGATIADSVGSNNGIWTDGVNNDVAEETVSGQLGTALLFDGADDDINFGNDSSLDITDNTMTIAGWVQKSVSSETGTMFYRGVDGSNGYQFSIGMSGCSSTQITFSKFQLLHGCFDGVPADTSWHHYAIVVDTTGMYSYVDGVLTDTNGNTQNIRTSTQNAYTRSNLNGSLDDLRIYGRALNAAEIKNIYDFVQDPCETSPSIGDRCKDGSYYVGRSPDGNVQMYMADGASQIYTPWSSAYSTTGFTSSTDGDGNTAGLIALGDAGAPYPAAAHCASLDAHGHQDWYLPARNEIILIYNGGSPIGDVNTGGTAYWSSSEDSVTHPWQTYLGTGVQNSWSSKLNSRYVRCVRR